MLTISHSKKEAYRCPFFFYHRYIKKTPFVKNPNLYEGSFLHDVACVYTVKLFENKLTSDSELLNLVFKELWKSQDDLPQDFYDSLYKVAMAFGERLILDLDTFYAAEYGIAFDENLQCIKFPRLGDYEAEDKWCQKKALWVHQRLDRINIEGSEAVITDYKSARAIKSASELKSKGQLKQYAWAFMTHPEGQYIEKVTAIVDYMRFENAKVYLEYTRDDVSTVETELRTFTEKLQQRIEADGPWTALQNDETCEMCTYQCPLNDPSLEIPKVIQDDETAFRLAQKAQAMKRDAKAIDDKLSVYTRQRPPLDLDIGEYAHRPSVTLRGLKADAVAGICMELGIDMNQFLKVYADPIKTLVVEHCRKHNLDYTAFLKLPDDDNTRAQIEDDVLFAFRKVIKSISSGTRFGFKPYKKEEENEE